MNIPRTFTVFWLLALASGCQHEYIRWSPGNASNGTEIAYIFMASRCPLSCVGNTCQLPDRISIHATDRSLPVLPGDLHSLDSFVRGKSGASSYEGLLRSPPEQRCLLLSDSGSQAAKTPEQNVWNRYVLPIAELSERTEIALLFDTSGAFREQLYLKKHPARLYRALMFEGAAQNSAGECADDQRKDDRCFSYVSVAVRNHIRQRLMYRAEHERIDQAKGIPKSGPHAFKIGLALSGGGIRSASFATGVLQGLNEGGILKRVGYLSSVSGGGFAASWYMMHQDIETGSLMQPGSRHLFHLAQYGNYLSDSNRDFTASDLVIKASYYALAAPVNLICNVIFDTGCNVGAPRDYYRIGLANAFQYRDPLPEQLRGYLWPDNYISKDLPISVFGPGQDRPFWIVNMHLSLIHDNSTFKGRTGDLVELTPLRAGGTAVGYVHLQSPDSGLGYWWNPHFAVAISGAAVDSQAGQVDALASMLIRGMGLDLGWYVNGWSYGWVAGDPEVVSPLSYWSTAFIPFFGKLSAQHLHTAKAKRYYLTDGGHFENLGAYSLVRRGVRLIIISDAGQDSAISEWDRASANPSVRARSFADLRRFEMLLYSDFGAIVEWQWDSFRVTPAENLCPEAARTGILVGRIRNLPLMRGPMMDSTVHIVYLKAVYNLAEHQRCSATFVDAEKGQNAAFPNNSTADQTYDERRVLAYRELGRSLAQEATPIIEDIVKKIP